MLFQPGQINVVFSLGTKILGELNYEMIYHAKKNLFEAVFFIKIQSASWSASALKKIPLLVR